MRSPTVLFFAFSTTTVLAQNLSESYAPVYVNCPTDVVFTRSATQGLNAQEETWLHGRKKVVAGALSKYLSNANLTAFDLDQYLSSLNDSNFEAVPGIGVAISGGGYASAIMGTGVLRALDGREAISNAAGTGGLLQALSFYSGQSGGSWAVSSPTVAEYPSWDELLDYWQPQINRFTAKTNGTHAATVESIVYDIAAKAKAGFNVSVADFLGRLNGYEFIKGPRGGLDVTMSGVQDLPMFKKHQMPLPIIQITQVTDADLNQLGLLVPTMKSPMVSALLTSISKSDVLTICQYEITPYEFGSWMQPVEAFSNMEYLGTTMMGGKPLNNSACVKGFDRVK